jgi:hypothetical protein
MTIWRGPLLVAAAITALAAVAVSVAVLLHVVPDPIGPAAQWGLAGASLSFTIARIIHTRRLRARELELLLAGFTLLLANLAATLVTCLLVLAALSLLTTAARRPRATRT